MNILILNWRDPKNPKAGGAEYVTYRHAKFWSEKGNNVSWLSEKFPGASEEEFINGIKIVRKSVVPFLYISAAFYYWFSGMRWDIVIDQIHGLPFFTPLYVRKPIIAYIHEVADEIWSTMYPFPVSFFGSVIEHAYFWLYRRTPFFVPSESTKKDLLGMGIRAKDILVVYGCVDPKMIVTRQRKEETPTFIFVSRLVKMKGVERVIEAFYFIKQTFPSAKLWIVGDGDEAYKKYLQDKSRSFEIDDSVVFFGYVAEHKKYELLRRAHVLLHASVKEGWGLVVLEAAREGTPSIVYDVSGLRDVVENLKTGIILPRNNPETMAQEAIQLYSDKKAYKEMQENCYRWAASFKWDRETEKSYLFLKKYSLKK